MREQMRSTKNVGGRKLSFLLLHGESCSEISFFCSEFAIVRTLKSAPKILTWSYVGYAFREALFALKPAQNTQFCTYNRKFVAKNGDLRAKLLEAKRERPNLQRTDRGTKKKR